MERGPRNWFRSNPTKQRGHIDSPKLQRTGGRSKVNSPSRDFKNRRFVTFSGKKQAVEDKVTNFAGPIKAIAKVEATIAGPKEAVAGIVEAITGPNKAVARNNAGAASAWIPETSRDEGTPRELWWCHVINSARGENPREGSSRSETSRDERTRCELWRRHVINSTRGEISREGSSRRETSRDGCTRASFGDATSSIQHVLKTDPRRVLHLSRGSALPHHQLLVKTLLPSWGPLLLS